LVRGGGRLRCGRGPRRTAERAARVAVCHWHLRERRVGHDHLGGVDIALALVARIRDEVNQGIPRGRRWTGCGHGAEPASGTALVTTCGHMTDVMSVSFKTRKSTTLVAVISARFETKSGSLPIWHERTRGVRRSQFLRAEPVTLGTPTMLATPCTLDTKIFLPLTKCDWP